MIPASTVICIYELLNIYYPPEHTHTHTQTHTHTHTRHTHTQKHTHTHTHQTHTQKHTHTHTFLSPVTETSLDVESDFNPF